MNSKLAMVSLLIMLPAYAQEHKDCSKAVGTLDQSQCISTELKSNEELMNKLYAQIMSYEPDPKDQRLVSGAAKVKESLRKSQQDWLSHRESDCELQASLWYGGTGGIVARSGCKSGMTIARVKELRDVIESMKNQ